VHQDAGQTAGFKSEQPYGQTLFGKQSSHDDDAAH
jgi:hypothetical protein